MIATATKIKKILVCIHFIKLNLGACKMLFVDMILQEFPFFKPYESYFVTYRMSAWVFLVDQYLSWPKILAQRKCLMLKVA